MNRLASVAIFAAIAAIVVGGLSYAGYELWFWLEEELKLLAREYRGEWQANAIRHFKFMPLVLVLFVFLSLAEIVVSAIDRVAGKLLHNTKEH